MAVSVINCKTQTDIVVPSPFNGPFVLDPAWTATILCGPCSGSQLTPVSTQLTIKSGTVSIASGSHVALLGPDGTTWSNPGDLRSVTILARKSNSTDAIVSSGANQVMVVTTDNKYILLEGESATYSVEDGNIQDFASVECLVNSAALVIYNRL